MKRINIAIAAVLVVVLSFCVPPFVLAEEAPNEGVGPIESGKAEVGDKKVEGDTVTVDAELWGEVVTMLEKIKQAQSGEAVGEIVRDTLFSRLTKWFGDKANEILLVLQAALVIVWTLFNRKNTPLLKNGINKTFTTVKELVDKDGKLTESIAEIKDKYLNTETKSKAAEISASAGLELMYLMLNNSNCSTPVKELGAVAYADAKKRIAELTTQDSE